MDILLGSETERGEHGRNGRGIRFYTDKPARTDPRGKPSRGVSFNPQGGGDLWDTWGNPYRVRFDTTFDNQVESPEIPGSFLPESIIVWSAGKDGDFKTWEDNVKTW